MKSLGNSHAGGNVPLHVMEYWVDHSLASSCTPCERQLDSGLFPSYVQPVLLSAHCFVESPSLLQRPRRLWIWRGYQ